MFVTTGDLIVICRLPQSQRQIRLQTMESLSGPADANSFSPAQPAPGIGRRRRSTTIFAVIRCRFALPR
jgi:hypothetical protein